WVCVDWFLTSVTDWNRPWWLHVIAASGIYTCNRLVVARRRTAQSARPSPFLRVYSAVAFTSLFCVFFLVASSGLWFLIGGIGGRLHAVMVGGSSAVAAPETWFDGGFRWFTSTGMAAIVLLFAYGYVFGQRALRISRHEIAIRKLRASKPLRVVQ